MSPELLERKGSRSNAPDSELPSTTTLELELGGIVLGKGESFALHIEKADRVQREIHEAKQISRIRYHQDVIDCLLENGDYEGMTNTLKTLLEDMGERDAARGKKNNIVEAIHSLSDHGIVHTKQTISKGPNGEERIIFAPLNKPGNFIKLDTERYEWYERNKPTS